MIRKPVMQYDYVHVVIATALTAEQAASLSPFPEQRLLTP